MSTILWDEMRYEYNMTSKLRKKSIKFQMCRTVKKSFPEVYLIFSSTDEDNTSHHGTLFPPGRSLLFHERQHYLLFYRAWRKYRQKLTIQRKGWTKCRPWEQYSNGIGWYQEVPKRSTLHQPLLWKTESTVIFHGTVIAIPCEIDLK